MQLPESLTGSKIMALGFASFAGGVAIEAMYDLEGWGLFAGTAGAYLLVPLGLAVDLVDPLNKNQL